MRLPSASKVSLTVIQHLRSRVRHANLMSGLEVHDDSDGVQSFPIVGLAMGISTYKWVFSRHDYVLTKR